MKSHLNLWNTFPRCRFIDGHLDGLFIVGHHYGPQWTVVRVDLLVVYGPEPMEHQTLLIPGIWRNTKRKCDGKLTEQAMPHLELFKYAFSLLFYWKFLFYWPEMLHWGPFLNMCTNISQCDRGGCDRLWSVYLSFCPVCALPAACTCAQTRVSYQSEIGTISASGWFPTMWSMKLKPAGGLQRKEEKHVHFSMKVQQLRIPNAYILVTFCSTRIC